MKLKKLMALGMAAVMTLSLTACGGKSDTPSNSSSATMHLLTRVQLEMMHQHQIQIHRYSQKVFRQLIRLRLEGL